MRKHIKKFKDVLHYAAYSRRFYFSRSKGTHKDRLKNSKNYREGYKEALYFHAAIVLVVLLMILFIIIVVLISKFR